MWKEFGFPKRYQFMLLLNEEEPFFSFPYSSQLLLIYAILLAKNLSLIHFFILLHLLVELSNFHNFLKGHNAQNTGIVLAWEHGEKHILRFNTVSSGLRVFGARLESKFLCLGKCLSSQSGVELSRRVKISLGRA